VSLEDSYKFISWLGRYTLSVVTGREFGDLGMDDSIGRAANEVKPATEIADLHPYARIGLYMCAGGWTALSIGDTPNEKPKKGGRKVVQERQSDK
jgi:hypothetical protein